ncbi:acyl-CoA carboxylase subunit epsilon [Nonomuraea sp. PA05]|uniref:acyl-CoA carboxylase epsilon subunit n=1 Tax=Nonomuraea sp. PA05 TaxID=2604466 RepID=UPI0011D7F1AC|nr:acyl-CoA carboxylase epsilon subunit [Nonomuraea sp. PA05]TYB71370.1 acyl-CoA carboxylase subunit epsilon [Nonomuraea sp. PA05]
MELTVVRGTATPDELAAIAVAVARCLARAGGDRETRWAESGRPSPRGPLPPAGPDGWRLSGWSAGRDLW